MTAVQALSSAGGFTAFANLKKIYVLRSENGQEEKLPVNYKEVINGRKPEGDIHLMTGDTIVVP
jgi:polysaccharide export outer membrane protein